MHGTWATPLSQDGTGSANALAALATRAKLHGIQFWAPSDMDLIVLWNSIEVWHATANPVTGPGNTSIVFSVPLQVDGTFSVNHPATSFSCVYYSTY